MWRVAAASRLGSRVGARGLAAAGAVGVGSALALTQEKSPLASCEPLLQQASSATPIMFMWGRLAPASGPDAPAVRQKTREPLDVTFFSARGLHIVDVAYGATFGAALDDKGGLWAWGETSGPEPRQLPCRAKLVSVAADSRADSRAVGWAVTTAVILRPGGSGSVYRG